MNETKPMRDGFYGIEIIQELNFGFGVLVFDNGRITGVDVGGACFDGSYTCQDASSLVDVTLTITIPANVESIFGTKLDRAWAFEVLARIDPGEQSGEIILRTPAGACLTARYRYMRPLTVSGLGSSPGPDAASAKFCMT